MYHDTVIAGTPVIDSTPTAGSNHAVSSGGVKSALDAKADKNDLATIHQTSPTCTETNGISAGAFFYLDNELVVAKTAIANGATFTNGTNYESPTAGGLNALKSAFFDAALTTAGLTPQNGVTIVSGGYCVIGNLVVVNIRLSITVASSGYKQLVTGFPAYNSQTNYVSCNNSRVVDIGLEYGGILSTGSQINTGNMSVSAAYIKS